LPFVKLILAKPLTSKCASRKVLELSILERRSTIAYVLNAKNPLENQTIWVIIRLILKYKDDKKTGNKSEEKTRLLTANLLRSETLMETLDLGTIFKLQQDP
jgi:hypothetical protein